VSVKRCVEECYDILFQRSFGCIACILINWVHWLIGWFIGWLLDGRLLDGRLIGWSLGRSIVNRSI